MEKNGKKRTENQTVLEVKQPDKCAGWILPVESWDTTELGVCLYFCGLEKKACQ